MGIYIQFYLIYLFTKDAPLTPWVRQAPRGARKKIIFLIFFLSLKKNLPPPGIGEG